MENPELTQKVIKIVKETALYSERERLGLEKEDIEEKGKNDLVSYVDVETEKILADKLTALLPGSHILGEETKKNYSESQFSWIIDPIDGTTNFLHGIPIYCISVALMKDGEIISGVIYDYSRNECFFTWKDGKSYLNESEIRVSEVSSLSNSLIATGFPFHESEILDKYLKILKTFMTDTHGIRRLGSAALDLAYVAAGRFDGFYEFNLKPWDVAAGCLLIQNAGGIVTDFKGEDNYIFGREIVAGNENVQPEILKRIKKYLKQ